MQPAERLWMIDGQRYPYDVLRAGDLNHTHIGKRIFYYGASAFIVTVHHGQHTSIAVRLNPTGRFKQWRLDENQEVFVTQRVV